MPTTTKLLQRSHSQCLSFAVLAILGLIFTINSSSRCTTCAFSPISPRLSSTMTTRMMYGRVLEVATARSTSRRHCYYRPHQHKNNHHAYFRRHSTSTTPCTMTIADTPLGTIKEGSLLLDGLDVFSVPASGDSHPLTVYGIQSTIHPKPDDHILLMLHGRTWSSVPVYHCWGDRKMLPEEWNLDP
jgi:hypothetical protein